MCFFQQFTGVNAVIFYSNVIFSAQMDESRVTLFTTIVNVIQVLATMYASRVIDLLGRRMMLIIGNSLVLTTLLLMSLVSYYNLSAYLALLTVSLYIAGFSLAAGPVTFIYLSDMLPDVGVSVCGSSGWVFTILIGYYFPIFNGKYGIVACFLGFSVCTIIGLVFMVFVVKETKGKS